MYRILIVDDEPMALYSTAHTFPWADWGFDPPVLMTEAPAALDKLRTERFDAAIVDIRMPQMTGIELLRKVRASEDFGHLPFLMVTAEAQQSNIIEAAQARVSNYIVKPFTAETMKQKIDKIFA